MLALGLDLEPWKIWLDLGSCYWCYLNERSSDKLCCKNWEVIVFKIYLYKRLCYFARHWKNVGSLRYPSRLKIVFWTQGLHLFCQSTKKSLSVHVQSREKFWTGLLQWRIWWRGFEMGWVVTCKREQMKN